MAVDDELTIRGPVETAVARALVALAVGTAPGTWGADDELSWSPAGTIAAHARVERREARYHARRFARAGWVEERALEDGGRVFRPTITMPLDALGYDHYQLAVVRARLERTPPPSEQETARLGQRSSKDEPVQRDQG